MRETQNSPGFQVVADLHLRVHYLTKNCSQIETICLIEEMRSIRDNKEVLQTVIHLSHLFAKIPFNPFDSVPLATLHFALLHHHERYNFAKILAD